MNRKTSLALVVLPGVAVVLLLFCCGIGIGFAFWCGIAAPVLTDRWLR
jgi:hypothetical protein